MKYCVAHYCEGAGHGTKMLAIARELAAGGHEVAIAGGGPGKTFVELNGYEEYEPRTVDFVGSVQGEGLVRAATRDVPRSVGRTRDYAGWLEAEDPALVVTDDFFAALASLRARVGFRFVKHDSAALYDAPVEKLGAWSWNRLLVATATAFFQPIVWEETIEGAERTGPIALDGEAETGEVGILFVPSAHSDGGIAERLADLGDEVTVVGGDGWEPKPSLQPYVRAAEAVVCSGYSTVMEAAVAGTPCVVVPETSEQRGVAARVDRIPGFRRATPDGIASAIEAVGTPRAYDNGAPTIAERVVELSDDG